MKFGDPVNFEFHGFLFLRCAFFASFLALNYVPDQSRSMVGVEADFLKLAKCQCIVCTQYFIIIIILNWLT